MKIVVKRAGRKPEVREIEHTLENLQEIVGGYIETFPFPPLLGVIGICNEEGKINHLPFNFSLEWDDIVGDVFFCRTKDCDFTDLTDEDIEKIKSYFNQIGE